MRILKSILFLLISLSFGFAYAQYTEVINSNRPGVSQSAFSVGTGIVQFEAGAFTVKEEHALRNYDVSGFGLDFALRYGLLFEQLELSLNGVYQNDKISNINSAIPFENKRSNFKNFTLGAKYLVYDPYKNAGEEKPNIYSYHANRKFSWKTLIPAVSVYAGANFDTKNNPFIPYNANSAVNNEGGFSPKVMIATQNNFNSGWVFVMNLIKDRIGTDQSDFQYILTLTHSFTPQWVVFGETQGIQSDFYADNIFRFGGAYLWTKDFQLDANIAFNTKDTPSVFNIAFGASYRLDFHKDKKIDNGTSSKDSKGEKRKDKKKNKKNKKKKADDFDS